MEILSCVECGMALENYYNDSDDEEVKENYFMHCKHNKKGEFEGELMCFECGLVLSQLYMNAYEDGEISTYRRAPMNKEKISAKEKQYNKKMQEMFPDLIFPKGNVMMKDIEKRFKLRKEPGDRFPTMKNLIHFILTKHEMTDLASTITVSKGDKFQDLMERIFKEDKPLSDFEKFKKLYKILEKSSKD